MIKLILSLLFYIFPVLIFANNLDSNIIYKTNDVIWGFTFIDNNTVVISEKRGKLGLLNINTKIYTPIAHNIPFAVHGQGGLLDLSYDTDNKLLFITYSKKTEKNLYTTALSRGSFSKDLKTLISHEIFSAKAESAAGVHFGSRTALDIYNKQIFMTIGDRGEREKAQDLLSHNGKVIRIDYEGKSISSNPFFDNKNALSEIYSFGHRNPQGIYLNKQGQLFISEFGPKGGDEINIIKPGKNYGWPLATYGREYSGALIAPSKYPGTEQPIVWYDPAISPSGMMIYEHDYHMQWKDDIFMGALSARHLQRVTIKQGLTPQKNKMFTQLNKRIRHTAYNSQGRIFFSTDSGELYIISK